MTTIMEIKPATTLRCDFNSLRADGSVPTARCYAVIIWHPLGVGSDVMLEDGEGNRCAGRVTALRPNHTGEADQIIDVRPRWEAWNL
jgi:hypothetical protein